MDIPALTPDTNPVLLTVATEGVPEIHGFIAAGVPEPVSWVVNPTQTESVPVIVGRGFTVMMTEEVGAELQGTPFNVETVILL